MANKVSKTRFLGGLAVALVLPLSFYAIARIMSKDKLSLPGHYVAEKVVAGKNGKTLNDTIYHQAADIKLINQLGANVSINSDLAGKIVVLDVFTTTCAGDCEQVAQNMLLLQKTFKKNPKIENSLDDSVQFISVSLDPVTDSVPVLRAFADAHHANHDHWWFLTGKKDLIENYICNELHLCTKPQLTSIPHEMVLLDKNRYIRGYYNGLDLRAIKHCADDIVLLTLEKDHVKK